MRHVEGAENVALALQPFPRNQRGGGERWQSYLVRFGAERLQLAVGRGRRLAVGAFQPHLCEGVILGHLPRLAPVGDIPRPTTCLHGVVDGGAPLALDDVAQGLEAAVEGTRS